MKQFMVMVVLCCLTIGSTRAAAQQIIAVTEDWPPYNYQDNENITGLSTEIVQTTLDRAGMTAEFRMYPWARAYNLALEQENLLIYTIVRTPEREQLFHWIGPIAPPGREVLYKLKSRPDIVAQSLPDLKQYKTGVWRDDVTHQYLVKQGFKEGRELFVSADNEHNLQQLFRGRIDLVAESEVSLPMRMDILNLPIEELEKVMILFEGEEEFYMAFSKQTSPALVERVRTAFEQIKAEGVVDAIVEKYMKIHK